MLKLTIIAIPALLLVGLFAHAFLSQMSDTPEGHGGEGGFVEKEAGVQMGKTLALNLKAGGTLDISGWERELVSLRVHLSGRDGKDCRVELNESASGLEIGSRYAGSSPSYSCDLRYEIKVPERINIKIDSAGGGVKVLNVEGMVEGKTMGGEVNLSNLAGTVKLTTMGGDIILTDSEVSGTVSTMGGHVLIKNVVGDVKGVSQSGNVAYENVTAWAGQRGAERIDAAARGEVRISSAGGEINVPEAPAGADLSTMGGNINVGSASGHLKVKTNGGDINVNAVDGWVQAVTLAGDVNVKVVGDAERGRRDVGIISHGGNITLTLPPTSSVRVDIQLAQTRNSRKAHKIVSDFDLQQTESDGWIYTEGTPRKYIYGSGTFSGGKHTVKIKTVDGDIYLKKGEG